MTRDYLSNSAAALLMIFAMLPGLLFALFERHGQPLEVVIQQMIQCCFPPSPRKGPIRPTMLTPLLCGNTKWNRR